MLHKRIQAPSFHCTFTNPEDFVTTSDMSITFVKDEKKLCDKFLYLEGLLIAPSHYEVGVFPHQDRLKN